MQASRLEIAAILAIMAVVIVAVLLFNGPIIWDPALHPGPSPDLR